MAITEQQKIVLASTNAGKIKEIQALLTHRLIVPQSQFNIETAAETGSTFVENAIIKAKHAACHSQLPAIADDSGLVVDALNGAPGVISARYAGIGASDQDNLQKVLKNLANTAANERAARFVCVVVFMRFADDPLPIIAQGVWEGSIVLTPVGDNGFGYDPIFWVPSEQQTSAELSFASKNKLSHRGQALRQLAALCR